MGHEKLRASDMRKWAIAKWYRWRKSIHKRNRRMRLEGIKDGWNLYQIRYGHAALHTWGGINNAVACLAAEFNPHGLRDCPDKYMNGLAYYSYFDKEDLEYMTNVLSRTYLYSIKRDSLDIKLTFHDYAKSRRGYWSRRS